VVIELIEIPLNSFRHRFRPLTWIEQSSLKFPAGEDQRMVVLAFALTNVSGFPVSSQEEARKILQRVPLALRWRIWVLYRGKQPVDRFFSTRGLYEAPEHQVHQKRVLAEGDASEDDQIDPAMAQLERKFGAQEVREAREVEQQMLAVAEREGKLVRTTDLETDHATDQRKYAMF
jgi:hypothetical protein